jgi:hypothetical protein
MKGCMKPFVALLTLVCLTSLAAYASTAQSWIPLGGIFREAPPIVEIRAASPEAIDMSYQLPGMVRTPVTTRGGEFTRLSVVDGGVWGEIGHPELPAVRKLVSIPYEAVPHLEILNLEVATISFDELGITSPIYPVQAPIEKIPGAWENAPFNFDEAAYSTDAFQLPAMVELGEIGVIRGYRCVELMIHPLDVNPVTRQVKVLSSVDLRISLVGSDMELSRAQWARYRSFPFETMTDRLVMKSTLEPRTRELNGMPEPPLLLIITDPDWEDNADLLDYVEWRFEKGFRPVLKTTDSTGTSATAIKAYLQNAYDNWPIAPTFVLLVGDVDAIPRWTGSGSGNPNTDLNYTLLRGSDYWPDVDLGRWSVANLTDLTNILNKTEEYEQIGWSGNDTWEKYAVFMASCDNYPVSEGTHNYVINNYLVPDGYDYDRLYCHTYNATTAQVTTSHNAGRSLSIYSGHGDVTYWVDGPPYYQSNVNALTNTVYPFVQSYACLTGNFMYSECFMETWLRDDHAAIGAMGSSVTSYWTEDDILEKRVMEGFCDNANSSEENQTWMAGMMNYGKIRYYAYFGNSGTTRRYFEMYNLMGDPSIDLWTAIPARIGVTHDSLFSAGDTTFDVTVSGVVDWALVCVHDENDEIYASQYLFESGTATMNLGESASATGMLHIAVTGHDMELYLATIQIVSGAGAVTDLTVMLSGNDLVLNWTPTNADEYHVYASDDPIIFGETFEVVTEPPYTIVGAAATFEQRFYQVIPVKN